MKVGWRTVDDSPLIDVRLGSLLLDGSGAVLWQLNYGSYGTFDFVFVVNLIVRLAVMVVGRTEGHVNAAIALVLLRVWSDDRAESSRPLRWLRRDDHERLVIFVLLLVLVVPGW